MSNFARSFLQVGACALILSACSASHTGPGTPDGGPTDGSVGERCGDDRCAVGETCCDLSCPGEPVATFCTPSGAGCPAIACPPPIVRSCEDLAAFGPGSGACEGTFACTENTECCFNTTECIEGELITSGACLDDCVPSGCFDSRECSPLEFCDFPEGTCGGPGACVTRPTICADVYCPVTGCDGLEYGNGCEAQGSGVDYAFPCGSGMPTGTYVVSFLGLAGADPSGDPSIIAGMNLDGFVSDGTDIAGCLHQDFVSPAPDRERGVDNQLGPIISAVGGSVDVDFSSAIARGDLLILIDVVDVGRETIVELSLGATADGAPPRLRGGRLVPGQAFAVVMPLGRLGGGIDGGRTRVGPGGLFFPIIPTDGFPLPLPLTEARLYGDVGADGIARGVIGGGFDVEDGVAAIVAIDPGAIPEALARSVLNAQADLSPDRSGACRRISAGWTFSAVPAVVTR